MNYAAYLIKQAAPSSAAGALLGIGGGALLGGGAGYLGSDEPSAGSVLGGAGLGAIGGGFAGRGIAGLLRSKALEKVKMQRIEKMFNRRDLDEAMKKMRSSTSDFVEGPTIKMPPGSF